jgi:hypothetical protein
VALAFLFAVFRSRPSPFYLMDEVEAALDDVNLQRFLGLVHEFRGEAQLIIVSHQKRTMEAADALYGVTMAPGGSSKVISQKVPRDGGASGGATDPSAPPPPVRESVPVSGPAPDDPGPAAAAPGHGPRAEDEAEPPDEADVAGPSSLDVPPGAGREEAAPEEPEEPAGPGGPSSEPGISPSGWQPRVIRPERVGGSEP